MVVRTVLNYFSKPDPKCNALVEEELCGRDAMGSGRGVQFCKRHVPSGAIPWGGRIEPVEFLVDGSVVEIE